MKHLRAYESVEHMPGDFYNLFGTLVYIDNIDMFGAEWRITMLKANGQKRVYIGSKQDVMKDFNLT